MTSSVIKELVQSFHTALEAIQISSESTEFSNKVKITSDFNNIIQRCVNNLPNEIYKFLRLTPGSSEQAHKSKKFIKIKGLIRSYLLDLIQILQNVTSESAMLILLKHLHVMLHFVQSFTSINKPLLKILLKLWSSDGAEVRIVSFKCILRLARQNKKALLEKILKRMYIKYVENSKFVSPSTLPGINFMRHSLVEIYLLDASLSYNQAFLYIRQLAIQLRNAITLKQKENYQAVYNWQYMNSLKFWSELLSCSEKKSLLNQLLYPLIQIINTVITLIPTAQYYPLRFHCVQMLTDISKSTGLFIPSLPYILEILSSYDFNKKHTSVSMKPLSMICILRMSKSHMQENGFKNSIIENIYRLILENAMKDSSFIYFPELYIPCIIQLKEFLKKNNIAQFGKQMKQLLNKIEENSRFIEQERKAEPLDLKNMVAIQNWENKIRTNGTPASKFFESWYKVYEEKLKIIANKTEYENDVPTESRNKVTKSKKGVKRKQTASDDSDLELPVEAVDKLHKKNEKPRKKKKSTNKKTVVNKKDMNDSTENSHDIVRDIRLDDWD